MPSIPAFHKSRPLGLAIADFGVAAVEAQSDGYKAIDVYRDSEPFPPAAICGELAGENLVADIAGSPHIRGSGLTWPPGSRVSKEIGSARIPAPIAWALCDHKIRDSWCWVTPQGRHQSVNSIDAIAEIAETVLSRVGAVQDDRLVTIVVPNTFDTEAQDELLRALSVRRIRSHLLWRPIAAALAWVNEHGTSILGAGSYECAPDVPLGALWIIHLGLDAFEITQLEVIPWQQGGAQFLLPARRLPSLPSLYGLGLEWAERIAEEALPDDYRAEAAWNLLWTTSWLRRVVTQVGIAPRECAALDTSFILHGAGVLDRGVLGARSLWRGLEGRTGLNRQQPLITEHRRNFAPMNGPFGQDKLARSGPRMTLLNWIAELRDLVDNRLPTLGIVGTGAFASFPCEGRTLAEVVIRLVSNMERTSRAMIDSESLVLGQGAAIYSNRRQASLPTFLDVLPKLELLIVRSGEPVFEDILRVDVPYVLGGEERTFEPENLGLRVRREERTLSLPVWREGHETVRAAQIEFTRGISAETPVKLRIKMTPGQGNPRVEVRPEFASAFGGRSVYVDWMRAQDTGRTREEELNRVPRTNPPLEKRLASLDLWRSAQWSQVGAQDQLLRFTRDFPVIAEQELDRRLSQLVTLLRNSDPEASRKRIPEHATVADCDGNIHPLANNKELFANFLNVLDGMLPLPKYNAFQDRVIRALGYCSAKTPQLHSLLRTVIRRPSQIESHHLVAIGNCLRDSTEIASFAEVARNALSPKTPGAKNDWMRAMCRVLQYRETAADEIASNTCADIARSCLFQLQRQLREGKAQYLFRHASLCIVYLLRRRRLDDSYLDPTSPLAKSIKQVFMDAIARFETGRLDKVDGFVDLPRVTQMMIDYVDRKGQGRLVGFAV